MKIKLQTTKIFFLVLGLFILSCAPVSELIGTPDNSDAGSDQQTTESPSATLPPTDVPTATVYPPVFDPEALGDNRELASFIVTQINKRTEDGKVEVDLRGIFEYIKEPFSMHWELGNMYVIGGASYERINAGKGWSYLAGPYQGDAGDVLEWQLVLIPASLVLQRDFTVLRDFASYYEILRFTLIGELKK